MTRKKSARPHMVGTGHIRVITHHSETWKSPASARGLVDWLKIQAGVVAL